MPNPFKALEKKTIRLFSRVAELGGQDLGLALQRRATETTAEYIERHMHGVDSTTCPFDLLTRAIRCADLGRGRLCCEFGVYSGATINHIASLAKGPVHGFDSFQGLPERWRDGFSRGHFRRDKLPKVRSNVVLVEGLFAHSLPPFLARHPGPAGFLHIDCDLYSSTQTIFDLLGGRIEPGCVIVFDEYFNYPGWQNGEYRAFQEFMARAGLGFEYIGYNRCHEQVAVRITVPHAPRAVCDENHICRS